MLRAQPFRLRRFAPVAAAAAPFFVALLSAPPNPPTQLGDTSCCMPIGIRTNAGTKPFNASTFMPPIRSVWHGLDTSNAQPLGIRTNAGLKPSFIDPPLLIARPQDVLVDTSRSMPSTLRTVPTPFQANTFVQLITSIWQGRDTSNAMPLGIRTNAGLQPFFTPPPPLVELRARDVYDTSKGMPLSIQTSLPAPFQANTFVLLPVSKWQPGDTTQSIPKVLTPDAVAPFFTASLPLVELRARDVYDTSRGAPLTIIGVPAPFQANTFSLLPISNWQAIDTSQSIPKVLTPDSVRPSFTPPIPLAVLRGQDVTDTSQSMPLTLQTFIPPVPPAVTAILWSVGPKGIKTRIAFISGMDKDEENK